MDIPGANHFIYKKYTSSEMMAALTEVMKRQPPPKMNIICSDGIYKAINEAIMDQWEIVSQKRSKCPNCGETALNDHCPHCDYPYN